MSQPLLPYFQSLSSTIQSHMTGPDKEVGWPSPKRLASLLLCRLTANAKSGLQLKDEFIASVAKLLPGLEKTLSAELISKLRSTCEGAETTQLDSFLALVGEVQRGLIEAATPSATALSIELGQTEATYVQATVNAVSEQEKVMVQRAAEATGARNARSYDEGLLVEFIRKTFPDESNILIKESGFIAGGYSKFTVRITLENSRNLPTEIILRGDASATFGGVSVVDEYSLLDVLFQQGVCVPKPLALESTGAVFGSPFMLVTRLPGQVVGNPYVFPPADAALNRDVAAKLAAIHRVPLEALGTDVDGAHYSSSEKAIRWIDEAQKSWQPLNMPSAVFESAFDVLRRNAHLSDLGTRGLVHGDYGLNNLLVEGSQVSAVLDWEFAHIANPAYDLAYFYAQAQALSSWEEFLDAYQQAGMPIPDQQQLDYHILLAVTRLGVMACQATAAFNYGIEMGPSTANIVALGLYEQTVLRLAAALKPFR